MYATLSMINSCVVQGNVRDQFSSNGLTVFRKERFVSDINPNIPQSQGFKTLVFNFSLISTYSFIQSEGLIIKSMVFLSSQSMLLNSNLNSIRSVLKYNSNT